MIFPLSILLYRIVPLFSVVALSVVSGQVVTPSVTFTGPRAASVPATASEALVNLGIENGRTAQHALSVTQEHYPKDSIMAVSARRAEQWVGVLQSTQVKGLHLSSSGVISIIARNEQEAQRQIAARLATPGLSLVDRAYTLEIAVSSFASSDYPARLLIAEQYLVQLDALGVGAAFWQFNARKAMIYAYYRLGRSQDVVRIGKQAFALVPIIPFELRETMYSPGISFLYSAVIDALSGQSNGKADIRAANVKLLEATRPTPALMRFDSSFIYKGEQYHDVMKGQVELAERVGEPGVPLVANYWVNRGLSRDSQVVAVNDGKIRVIELGSFTCAPCMSAVPGLERLYQKYPDVEFNFMTACTGVWGNRIVEPKIEAGYLADHLVNKLKATFPIGIATTHWVEAEDGGEQSQLATSTWSAGNYPQPGKPTFYILDGQGIIRHVVSGYNRDFEENLSNILDFLQKEATGAKK